MKKPAIIVILVSVISFCLICVCCFFMFVLVAGNDRRLCDRDRLKIDFPINFCIN